MPTRREFLGQSFFAAAAAAAASAQPARRPPNVVLILADDLGWADLGCTGSDFYETPHLDRLASAGVRFTNGYATCPVCSPSRASLQTGKYPQRVGITDYIGAAQPDRWPRPTPLLPAPYREQLPLEEVTLAEAFGAAGYATGFFGKWHLGEAGFWPEQQGYQVNRGGCGKGACPHTPPYMLPNLPDGPKDEYLADRLTDEALAFMEQHRAGPFLSLITHYDVHTPLTSKPDVVAKYRAKSAALGLTPDQRFRPEGASRDRRRQDHAVYAAMMACLDDTVGRVMGRLEALGIADETIVVFTSDNGGLSTSEGTPTSNAPLRAGKGWLYEGGVRVPLLIRAPGRCKPGLVSDVPMTTCDLYPTLLALCGQKLRPEQHRDGVNMAAALTGGMVPGRPLFWHYPHYGNQGGRPGGAVRHGQYKLIEWYGEPKPELFDLLADPGESRNIAEREPKLAVQLQGELARWRRDVGARMPTPNPKAAP
ncbi:MAG: sulfatase [Armatimonadetes bacterium]|nr:sulfatase [Armatimonadota bacterium]